MSLSKNLTITQIAEKANVSIATASRVINQSGAVKAETREKVLQAMKSLNYQAKESASKLILASFADFQNPFNGDLIHGMRSAATRRGYKLFLQQMENPYSPESYKFLLSQKIFSGVLFAHVVPEPNLLSTLRLQYPIVMCSEYSAEENIPFVVIDDFEAAQTAMKYLISIGKRRIALLNSSLDHNYAVQREHGYRAALAESNLPIRENWIAHLTDIDFESACSAATNILSSAECPDAFFCVSDVFASAVIKAARALKLSIPQDIAIVGFDNVYLTTMTVPSITTVSQPIYQIGFLGANLLIDQIEGKPILNHQVVLSTDLIVRGST